MRRYRGGAPFVSFRIKYSNFKFSKEPNTSCHVALVDKRKENMVINTTSLDTSAPTNKN